MSIDTSVYGNAPLGEHFAVFQTAGSQKYPSGMRFVVGFVIVNPETKVPLEDADGNILFAVAVCNLVGGGGNAKSKQFKIRKAMLRAEEFDPIGNAASVPGWDHFTQRLSDGSWRILKIRVATKGENGKRVSVVTHIERPREGQWEPIDGVFDGPPYPWINLDGTRKKLPDDQIKKLSGPERDLYEVWNDAPSSGKRWFDGDKRFKELPPGELAKFDR
jgi:hypothetical protein